MVVPILETPRLILRAPAIADFDAAFAIRNEDVVTRYINGQKSTPEEVWNRLLRYVGHWAALGYGFWTIVERETGAILGETGFADFHREMTPSFGDTPEMGWVLAGAAHGRGYATEAVCAALAWADAHLKRDRVVCMINPQNAPSIRVAEKAGFRETGRTAYHGEPVNLYERPTSAA
ncbi:MAG: GNAT family N-acetyltransferase [Hyphomonadaceae bacterium]|nr:GNAT family N-acetyltransferase [Hyphomonadaceae bacterium]